MIEDREPDAAAEPLRFQARIDRRDRTPQRLVALAAILAAIAIVKPWGVAAEPAPRPQPADRRAATTPPPPSTREPAGDRPTVTVHPAIAAVRTVCLGPASWRMASIETWAGQQVRVWRALDPGAASGPSDPAIPVVAASGSPVTAIGFCAPVHGSEVPNGRSDVDAWRVDGESTERIDLRQVAPVGSTSQFGALFGPPGGGRAPVWAEGKIVFRHTERASGIERWFAIEVAGEALR